jgi:flagellar hook protein FlgE
MSLFGALFTGVSGMNAQTQSTAIISNNIANVSTIGFKKSEAQFFSLVTSRSRSSTYSPGTVSTNRIQNVDQQGAIQQTASTTDVAISGNGLLAVKEDPDTQNELEFLYTRSGSFTEDEAGNLRNTSGFVLYGVQIDPTTNEDPTVSDISDLVPVNVGSTSVGNTRPTTEIEISLNLDASTDDSTLSNTLGNVNDFQTPGAPPPDFSRAITIFDATGAAQTLTLEFTKTYGPHATIANNVTSLSATDALVGDLAMTPGHTFDIATNGGSAGANSLTLTVVNTTPAVAGEVQTIGDIINEINDNLPNAYAFLGNDGELVIQHDEFMNNDGDATLESITISNNVGTALANLGYTDPQTDNSNNLENLAEGYDNGTAANLYSDGNPAGDVVFPAPNRLPDTQTSPGYNPRGWWQVQIVHPDLSTIGHGLINFNGDGSLNALSNVPTIGGDSTPGIDIELGNVRLSPNSEPQDIVINVENFSQFSGSFNVNFVDQNGAALGLRTGLEITREGIVVARFSNGSTTDLFKLPLIKFNNPNGLTEVSGTAYVESAESGSTNPSFAGEGGAGFFETSTIESSNVDIAEEFANLIVTQRAFSSNTRIINTVDQMTEDLLRII